MRNALMMIVGGVLCFASAAAFLSHIIAGEHLTLFDVIGHAMILGFGGLLLIPEYTMGALKSVLGFFKR